MPPKVVQIRYIREIVKLMLGFMYRLQTEKGVPFSVALADYADIYRKTAFCNLKDESERQRLRPRWEECAAKLEGIFVAHLSRGRPAIEVEEKGLELLWPHLLERIERGLPLVEYNRDAEYGCFYYHHADSVIDLHFTNTVMPQAPFRDLAARARELHALVRDCVRRHPGASRIKSGTWLNAYPPFRRLFPGSWQDSGEPKRYNSLGWWGQFVNHEGDIHARNAAKFRATGEFPYRGTFHHCETRALEEHLARMMDNPEMVTPLDRGAPR